MKAIPTAVCLTVYADESEDFMRTPLKQLSGQIEAGRLRVQIAKTFHLDDIVLAHRLMEENKPVERSLFSPERACQAETKYLSSRTLAEGCMRNFAISFLFKREPVCFKNRAVFSSNRIHSKTQLKILYVD
jgi:hypothetical protein